MKKRIIAAITAAALTLPAVYAPAYSFVPVDLMAVAADECKTVKDGCLTFEVYSDHAEVAECDGGVAEVVIPESVEGVPVTIIQEDAFQDVIVCTLDSFYYQMEKLTSVTIPDSVVYILSGAFSNCRSLTEIKGGNTVEYIGECAFQATPWLNNAKFNGIQLILGKTLVNAGGITGRYTVPDGITSIFYDAFSNDYVTTKGEVLSSSFRLRPYDNETAYKRVNALVLPEGFKGINTKAFWYIWDQHPKPSGNGVLYIPKSVSYINTSYLITIKDIWYAGTEEDWNEIEIKGDFPEEIEIHFNAEGIPETEGVIDPEYTKFDITPNELHSIKSNGTLNYAIFSDHAVVSGAVDNAFTDKLVIPAEFDGKPVTSVYTDAFKDSAITSVTIPDTITSIGENAFMFSDTENSGVKDIWYAGSEEQWNAIYSELAIPEGVTVHFGAEGIPAKEEQKSTSGDANCDGKVNVADSVAVLQFIVNRSKYALSEEGKNNADCDGRPGITGLDSIAIQRFDAGLIAEFGGVIEI